jgi:hypothetical protein
MKVFRQKMLCRKKKLALQSEISDDEQELIKIDDELKKRQEPSSPNRHKWIMAIIIILCLFDGLFSVPIWESFGYSKLEAWVCGIFFGLILAVFSHMFPKIVNLGKTKFQRILITIGLSGLSIGLFTFMSLSRVKYLESLAQSQGILVSYSSIPFILTSILMLGTSVFLSYFYYPNKGELQAIKEFLKLKNEKEKT